MKTLEARPLLGGVAGREFRSLETRRHQVRPCAGSPELPPKFPRVKFDEALLTLNLLQINLQETQQRLTTVDKAEWAKAKVSEAEFAEVASATQHLLKL